MAEPRTAIVTGAGKRVGAHLAAELIERGWTIVAHVRNRDDEVAAGAVKAVADLSTSDCAESIFAATDGLPPVRLLVNNAARFAWDGFGEFNPDEFDSHLRINVRAPILLIEALAARHEGGDALVVNLLDSKIAAPNPDFLSYTVSKQALLGVTELAARALAPSGVRVNAIAPALMLRSPGQSEENFQAMHTRNPLGRGVTPHDVVAAVDYLVENQVLTGQVLNLDAGERFNPPHRDVQFLEA